MLQWYTTVTENKTILTATHPKTHTCSQVGNSTN